MASDTGDFSDQSEGIRLCGRAVNADNRGHFSQAYKLYNQGISLILSAIHGARGGQAKETMLLRVEGYLKRMEQLKSAGYGRRRVSRHSSTGSGDGGRQGPRGMIEGAGTLNASGASDAPSSPEPVDPGFTHSIPDFT